MLYSSNTNLTNVFKTQSNIKMDAGCLVEYNMNMLTNLTDANVTGPAYKTFDGGRQPFKKLFPLDTIIQSFRPKGAGIKYAIAGDISRDYVASSKTGGDWTEPSVINYPYNYRTYFPGLETTYKYWVSNIGEGGTISITYPKTIMTNKIVLGFEISHATPPTWTIYGTPAGGSEGTLATGTSTSIVAFGSGVYNAGTLTLYYNGSTWSTDASTLNVNAQVSLTSIKATFGGVTNKYIGVIDFSPRWVKDISSSVVDFSINKNTSGNVEDVLPVGLVTANTLMLNLNKYNNSSAEILSYDRVNSYALDSSKIYMYKQIQIKPHFKVYHENGAYGSAPNKYDIVEQGIFYVSDWDITEFNDVSVTALDGAKILQETLAPSILCENYSITAILRRLLDSIGFTNYKFNVATNDKSIISPNYWWSDDNKTVWQCIQEICRDTQMTAVFDENDVLQFYTRDYLYGLTELSWYYTPTAYNTYLPNIISLNKKELASANQVIVRWKSAVTSNYERNSDIIWKSDPTFLAASGLISDLNSTDVSTYNASGDVTSAKYISLEPVFTSNYTNQQQLYSYSGYLVIEDEIIEYDAIRYAYLPVNSLPGASLIKVDITSSSDLFKYRGLAQPGSENMKPTGEYRIKARGVFGTGPSVNTGYPHRSGTDSQLQSWTVKEVKFR